MSIDQFVVSVGGKLITIFIWEALSAFLFRRRFFGDCK